MPQKVAQAIFATAKIFWLAVLIVFLVTYAANIAPLPRDSFVKTFPESVFGFFFFPLWHLILTLSVLLLLLALTLVAWRTVSRQQDEDEQDKPPAASVTTKTTTNVNRNNRATVVQVGEGNGAIIVQGAVNAPMTITPPPLPVASKPEPDRRHAVLHNYLSGIISRYANLNPTGIASPQSQALLSVSVPLTDIFIHLRAERDTPRFGLAMDRQKRLEELEAIKRRTDLTPDERETQVQELLLSWQSELDQEVRTGQPLREEGFTIEQVFARMTPQQPVAVLLGDPGAGKSTTLKWLALHMARAMRDAQALPEGLAPAQIPLLVSLGDYARYLTEATTLQASGQRLSFKAFLQRELSSIDSALPPLLEEALAHGQCVLLLDGLDEVASDDLRMRVRDELLTFLAHCPTDQHTPTAFTRCVITSRIVGYQRAPLSQYSEYTLSSLNDEQMEAFLSQWCPAVERHLKRGTEAAHDEREIARAGEEQKNRLVAAIRATPSIKRLAVNPLMLTILALLQKSGGRLPHQRIDLYKSITRTLLDNWNQGRGGYRFSSEQLGLAEDLLSALAFQMHHRDLPLTEQQTLTITRDTMSTFYAREPESLKDEQIREFIETLSEMSGLFVQRGRGIMGAENWTDQ